MLAWEQVELWDLGISCGKEGILTFNQNLLPVLGYGNYNEDPAAGLCS